MVDETGESKEERTRSRLLVVQLLAENLSHQFIESVTGVWIETIREWLSEESFVDGVAERRRARFMRGLRIPLGLPKDATDEELDRLIDVGTQWGDGLPTRLDDDELGRVVVGGLFSAVVHVLGEPHEPWQHEVALDHYRRAFNGLDVWRQRELIARTWSLGTELETVREWLLSVSHEGSGR